MALIIDFAIALPRVSLCHFVFVASVGFINNLSSNIVIMPFQLILTFLSGALGLGFSWIDDFFIFYFHIYTFIYEMMYGDENLGITFLFVSFIFR